MHPFEASNKWNEKTMHIWIFSSWIILCQTTNPYNYCIYTIFHSCARISSTDQTNILIWFNNVNKYIWAVSISIKWPFKHGNRFTRLSISKYSWYHRSTYVYKIVTSIVMLIVSSLGFETPFDKMSYNNAYKWSQIENIKWVSNKVFVSRTCSTRKYINT